MHTSLRWTAILIASIFIAWCHAERASAAPAPQIYLPIVAGNHSAVTVTPTPVTPTPVTPTPVTPTPVTPTATPTGTSLSETMVGTWFTGNAPLNDFYNPTTGEWRDVNGVGQMYEVAGNGDYTYTAFARFQTGACRSEVSVYKRGVASTAGDQLTLTIDTSKTRTVTICPTPHESITDGGQAPVVVDWRVEPDEVGIVKLSLIEAGTEGPITTQFYRLGMAESIVGIWRLGDITPTGFYNPDIKAFDPDSAVGEWFDIAADGSYRHGEHGFSQPNAEGCVLEAWVYQTGMIEVVGGVLTIRPEAGVLAYINSCDGQIRTEDPWTSEPQQFAWKHLDLAGDIKLVLIRLMPFGEYTFHR